MEVDGGTLPKEAKIYDYSPELVNIARHQQQVDQSTQAHACSTKHCFRTLQHCLVFFIERKGKKIKAFFIVRNKNKLWFNFPEPQLWT